MYPYGFGGSTHPEFTFREKACLRLMAPPMLRTRWTLCNAWIYWARMEVQTEMMLNAADNIDPQNTLGAGKAYRGRRERMRNFPRGFAPPIPGSAAAMKTNLLNTETLAAHMQRPPDVWTTTTMNMREAYRPELAQYIAEGDKLALSRHPMIVDEMYPMSNLLQGFSYGPSMHLFSGMH